MKKVMAIFLSLMILLTGCGPKSTAVETRQETAASVETVTEETEPTETVLAEIAPAETMQEEITPEDQRIIEEYLKLYRPVLEQYANALNEKWEDAQYVEAGLSNQVRSYVGQDGSQRLGYGLEDLDGDGIMELLIGLYEHGYLMDAYRLNGTEPERLAAAMSYLDENPENYPEILWEDWYLCREESGSFHFYYEVNKDWLTCGYFRVVLEQGQMRITESLLYNSAVDADAPWYRTDGYTLDYTEGVPISHEEAGLSLDGYVDREGMRTGMLPMGKLKYSWRFSDFS